MPSITSWMRLEPRSRDAEMTSSLQAKVYDPLWLLARQWQLGEFQGEDNGSPVLASWRGETARLTRYAPGAIGSPPAAALSVSYDPRQAPLETLVEREPVRPAREPAAATQLRQAVEAGQHFLRILEGLQIASGTRREFQKQFPFLPLPSAQQEALDADSLHFFELVSPRVLDGRRLYAALRPLPGSKVKLPAGLNIPPADAAKAQQAAEAWVTWYESLFSEPKSGESPWSAERLEYTFSVAARFVGGEQVLTAPEYYGGRLDWYAFDAERSAAIGAAGDSEFKEVAQITIPAPASFRGMPAARFWEFEDAQVDFGSVEAGPSDLARMLLVEFALVYGNDWFVIPVDLEVGSLCRTRSLVVTDTFGTRMLINAASAVDKPQARWHMFELAQARREDRSPQTAVNLFFLPPALVRGLEGEAVEEVLFLRDEMANLAWGIERVVESASERPLNRYEDYSAAAKRRAKDPQGALAQAAETLGYRLMTGVPEYWIPLLPVKTAGGLRFRRGAVVTGADSDDRVRARGRILEAGHALALLEEELPREGVRVSRSYQFTRWIDGSSHLWMGRRKGAGRGEGSSGLLFDSLDAKD